MARGLKIKVTQDPEKPVAAEVIAESILGIARGIKQLTASRVKREAVVVLIHSRSGICKRDINVVLDNLESLEKDWLKPPTQK